MRCSSVSEWCYEPFWGLGCEHNLVGLNIKNQNQSQFLLPKVDLTNLKSDTYYRNRNYHISNLVLNSWTGIKPLISQTGTETWDLPNFWLKCISCKTFLFKCNMHFTSSCDLIMNQNYLTSDPVLMNQNQNFRNPLRLDNPDGHLKYPQELELFLYRAKFIQGVSGVSEKMHH